MGDLLDYLDDNTDTVEEMLTILKSIERKDILTYGYFLPGMIRLCKLLVRKKSDSSDEESTAEVATWEEVLDLGIEHENFIDNLEILGEDDIASGSSEDTEIVIE